MRVGLIGPADGDVPLLREACDFLISDADVDQAIYLGIDDAIDLVVTTWAEEIMEGSASTEAFLDRAVVLARDGDAQAIRKLLDADRDVQQLQRIRKVPPPPARAVDMIDDRIITVVYDKATLDEDDIANATLLVYGKSEDTLLKRFGPRYFFTPGPLARGKLAILQTDADGQLVVELFDPAGAPLWREALAPRASGKMMVSQ